MQRAASRRWILIGTGSEVALCVDAYEALTREGIAARVVSMPSWELFEQQGQTYRDSILPPNDVPDPVDEVCAKLPVLEASLTFCIASSASYPSSTESLRKADTAPGRSSGRPFG
jgi:transketolase